MDAELKTDPELRFFTNQVMAEMAVALGLGLVTHKELSGGGPEQMEETLEAALQTPLGIIGVIPREVSDAEVKELEGKETSYAFMPEGSKPPFDVAVIAGVNHQSSSVIIPGWQWTRTILKAPIVEMHGIRMHLAETSPVSELQEMLQGKTPTV